MTILNKEQILSADDAKRDSVEVPEWGGEVLVKGLSGKERDDYEASIMQQDKKGNLSMRLANARAKLVVAAAISEDGSRLFSNEDVAALGAKSAKALSRVYNTAAELSGLKDEDLEELVGNSEADQGEG